MTRNNILNKQIFSKNYVSNPILALTNNIMTSPSSSLFCTIYMLSFVDMIQKISNQAIKLDIEPEDHLQIKHKRVYRSDEYDSKQKGKLIFLFYLFRNFIGERTW